jgi:formylglycine-generating enzyme
LEFGGSVNYLLRGSSGSGSYKQMIQRGFSHQEPRASKKMRRTPSKRIRLLGRTSCAALLLFGLSSVGVTACGTGTPDGGGVGGVAAPSGGQQGSGGNLGSGGMRASGGAGSGGLSSGGLSNGGQGSGGSSTGGAVSGTGSSAGVGGSGGTTLPGGTGGGASAEPPSCGTSGPGKTTCGESGDESCCTSLTVEGGTYFRTYTNTGNGATGESDAATVSTFRLDEYEVTVARFREYVKYLEGGGTPPAEGSGKHTHLNDGQGLADSAPGGDFESGWDASWSSKIPSGAGATAKWKALLRSQGTGSGGGCQIYGTWTDEPGDNDELPITCTSWYEAHAFCIWDDGFLPSEAEWKYAAAGGDEQRAYPWGSTAPGSENEYAIYDCCYPSGNCISSAGRDTCTGLVNVAPVGFAKKGVGRYGQFDLIGSVWEWNLDRYSNSLVNPCEDCAYLNASTTNRVLPGAGFHTGSNLGSTLMYSSNRTSISYDAETYRGDYAVGVRCARAP